MATEQYFWENQPVKHFSISEEQYLFSFFRVVLFKNVRINNLFSKNIYKCSNFNAELLKI